MLMRASPPQSTLCVSLSTGRDAFKTALRRQIPHKVKRKRVAPGLLRSASNARAALCPQLLQRCVEKSPDEKSENGGSRACERGESWMSVLSVEMCRKYSKVHIVDCRKTLSSLHFTSHKTKPNAKRFQRLSELGVLCALRSPAFQTHVPPVLPRGKCGPSLMNLLQTQSTQLELAPTLLFFRLTTPRAVPLFFPPQVGHAIIAQRCPGGRSTSAFPAV